MIISESNPEELQKQINIDSNIGVSIKENEENQKENKIETELETKIEVQESKIESETPTEVQEYKNESETPTEVQENKIETETQIEVQKEDNTIKNNSVLLVSELQNKVILPYTCAEIEEIIKDKNNNYSTPQEVIDNIFTKKLTYYRDSMFSRYREAYNLAFYRCNCSRLDAIKLGFEVCRKRFLHPAIISACKTLEDLDVYLDCLNKNELEEFKIFEIKYEIPPLLPQYNKIFSFFHRNEKYNY